MAKKAVPATCTGRSEKILTDLAKVDTLLGNIGENIYFLHTQGKLDSTSVNLITELKKAAQSLTMAVEDLCE